MRSLARKKSESVEMTVTCPDIEAHEIKESAYAFCKLAGEDWTDEAIQRAWMLEAESDLRAKAMVGEFDRLLIQVGERYNTTADALKKMESVGLVRTMLAQKVVNQVMSLKPLPEDYEWGMLVAFKV